MKPAQGCLLLPNWKVVNAVLKVVGTRYAALRWPPIGVGIGLIRLGDRVCQYDKPLDPQ